jgi:N-acetylneuraminate synthase
VGRIEDAERLIDAIAESGAWAVKLQTYTADTMTLPIAEREFRIDDHGSLWAGSTLHDLYTRAHTPWEWHASLFRRARERGLVCFSSPFDESAVDFLETLDCPMYKIASFENGDLPLIRYAAGTGKPLIISTGMATREEIGDAVAAARDGGAASVTLLKCTSAYPADPTESNLLTIPALRREFGCEVGLSDHTLGIGAAIAAVALGATMIEKHVTLSRAAGGVDAAFSLEPQELTRLVHEVRAASEALGGEHWGPTESERGSLAFRRSLYFVRDVARGATIAPGDLRRIRPGHGLPPKYEAAVVGRRTVRDVRRGEPVRWEDLEGGGPRA